MNLGSERSTRTAQGAEWERAMPRREMRLADLTVDSDGLPLIGTPLGRREVTLEGCIARETFKIGKVIGWHDDAKSQPILEYPDGTRETLFAMTETDWKTI